MSETITPTSQAQLFGELTDIDRQILLLEQAKGLLEQIPQCTHYLDAAHGNNPCDFYHVCLWIDHNIDQCVSRKMDIRRELSKPAKIERAV